MGNQTTTLTELGVEVPLENYDVGYRSPAKSYAQLLREALQAADEQFATGSGSFRNLSSFSSLRAARDWSASPGSASGVVYLDENFRTDETNILLDERFTLIGDRKSDLKNPYVYPAIISTNTSDSDPLFRYNSPNVNINFDTVNFFNDGDPRAFFAPASGYSGFWGSNMRWSDVTIDEFGATQAHPFTVKLVNTYGAVLSDVLIRNRRVAETHGAFHFDVCNAAEFANVQAVDNQGDGKTPCVYVTNSRGLHLDSLHIEKYDTDAALQITNSNVTLTNHYSEANDAVGAHCGIQIGDGGLTRGNTGGRVDDRSKVTIIEPVVRKFNKTPAENIRYLNGQHVEIVGGGHRHSTDADDLTNINYGGSNQHTNAELTGSPGVLHCSSHPDYEIVNNSGRDDAEIIADLGKVYNTESAARSGMTIGEWARINRGTRSALAWRNGAGDVRVWWNRPPAPTNLAGVTGDYDGQRWSDDGTNTAGRGVICVWDGIANAWRRPDGTSFS